MIILALKFEFVLLILAIYEIKLVILVFVEVILLHRFVYSLIIDDKGIQIIDKAGCIRWRISEAGDKSKVSSTYLNNVLTKMYSAVIYRIYASWYSIKLDIKFTNIFGY